ncbi:hypothetical protein IW261DRAFT_1421751 [Armillaria novae-zelandiae]|uniref:Uncharacterized protein n=1 Tax=Armillaria novae-zelandiae TaxID=153914 RepID=A0AA39TAP7_9AGAR|nr:hypothetical protein IW261DRAFT_1421751 [Armillaria novae-zelandiae]
MATFHSREIWAPSILELHWLLCLMMVDYLVSQTSRQSSTITNTEMIGGFTSVQLQEQQNGVPRLYSMLQMAISVFISVSVQWDWNIYNPEYLSFYNSFVLKLSGCSFSTMASMLLGLMRLVLVSGLATSMLLHSINFILPKFYINSFLAISSLARLNCQQEDQVNKSPTQYERHSNPAVVWITQSTKISVEGTACVLVMVNIDIPLNNPFIYPMRWINQREFLPVKFNCPAACLEEVEETSHDLLSSGSKIVVKICCGLL